MREDGTVKVLDFGLAKALARETPDQDLSQSPTMTATMGGTREGVILGTAAYMSPEQARGKLLDKRTDIWSFGCVLYEMLSGRTAFGGETLSDTFANVLDREPQWEALPAGTPPAIRRVLRRCLDRDVRERSQHIGDARVELRDAHAGEEGTEPAPGPLSPTPWRRALPWAAGTGFGLAAAIVVWGSWDAAPEAAPPARFIVSGRESGSIYVGLTGRDLAISPDGQRVAYHTGSFAARQMQVRALQDLDPVTLIATGQPQDPVFSPDGEWVAFFDLDDRTLKKVAVIGGPVQPVCAMPGRAMMRGAAWADDDTIVFGTQNARSGVAGGLWRVPAVGGKPARLTTAGDAGHHHWPTVLPGGQTIIFTIVPHDGGATRQVSTAEVGTPRLAALVPGEAAPRELDLDGSHPRYLSTGHLVYSLDDTLQAVRFDPDRLVATGAPSPVVNGVIRKRSGAANFDVARNGSLVFMPAATGSGNAIQRTLVWVDAEGREEPLPHPPAVYNKLRLSPDGNKVAVDVMDSEVGTRDVWVYDANRPIRTRLTFDAAEDSDPVWSPDGERVVFGSERDGGAGFYWKLADGSGPAEPLWTATEDLSRLVPSGWSADGQTLLFWWVRPGTGSDIIRLSMEGERLAEPLLDESFSENTPGVSPNGRWMVYTSWETGEPQVYVRPFPGLGGKHTVSTDDGGQEAVWSLDGRVLFYRSPRGMMRVDVSTGEAFSAGDPELLFEGRYHQLQQSRTYDLAPDGRFLMLKEPTAEIVLVQNWFEELKAQVPIP